MHKSNLFSYAYSGVFAQQFFYRLNKERRCIRMKDANHWKAIGSGEEWLLPFPHRTASIGLLRGTWYEMGKQYGERAAYDILKNTDTEWERSVDSIGEEELKNRIKIFTEQVYYYSPITIKFLEGIADGAAPQFSKSEFALESSNLERVLALNLSGITRSDLPDHGCNSFWVSGKATVDNKAIATHHTQGELGDAIHGNQVTFTAIPDDPDARIVFWQTDAGCIGRGGAALNDAGVYTSMHIAETAGITEARDWGVEIHLARFHMMHFSNSAEEAANYYNFGTANYREKTGRETLLRTRGVSVIYADANIGIIGEYNARRYALRKPGDYGETGDYIVCSNHNKIDYSYDENNNLTDVPMTKYAPENTSSYYRYWSPKWAIRNNYGFINIEMVLRELTTLHKRHDSDGNEYDYQHGQTFCAHDYNEETGNPSGTGGVSVVVPENLEIYYLSGWPCRFEDKSWNYINLNDYKELRKQIGPPEDK